MNASLYPTSVYHVLLFCNGNSARSILAEAILNRMGKGKFIAFSAGIDANDQVNPHTLKLLNGLGFSTEGLRSKSWHEFFTPDAPVLDFIFEVCDNKMREILPDWLGQPMTAYWGVPDPAGISGTEPEIVAAFYDAFSTLRHRIELFTSLPIYRLNKNILKQNLDHIGTLEPPLVSGHRH